MTATTTCKTRQSRNAKQILTPDSLGEHVYQQRCAGNILQT